MVEKGYINLSEEKKNGLLQLLTGQQDLFSLAQNVKDGAYAPLIQNVRELSYFISYFKLSSPAQIPIIDQYLTQVIPPHENRKIIENVNELQLFLSLSYDVNVRCKIVHSYLKQFFHQDEERRFSVMAELLLVFKRDIHLPRFIMQTHREFFKDFSPHLLDIDQNGQSFIMKAVVNKRSVFYICIVLHCLTFLKKSDQEKFFTQYGRDENLLILVLQRDPALIDVFLEKMKLLSPLRQRAILLQKNNQNENLLMLALNSGNTKAINFIFQFTVSFFNQYGDPQELVRYHYETIRYALANRRYHLLYLICHLLAKQGNEHVENILMELSQSIHDSNVDDSENHFISPLRAIERLLPSLNAESRSRVFCKFVDRIIAIFQASPGHGLNFIKKVLNVNNYETFDANAELLTLQNNQGQNLLHAFMVLFDRESEEEKELFKIIFNSLRLLSKEQIVTIFTQCDQRNKNLLHQTNALLLAIQLPPCSINSANADFIDALLAAVVFLDHERLVEIFTQCNHENYNVLRLAARHQPAKTENLFIAIKQHLTASEQIALYQQCLQSEDDAPKRSRASISFIIALRMALRSAQEAYDLEFRQANELDAHLASIASASSNELQEATASTRKRRNTYKFFTQSELERDKKIKEDRMGKRKTPPEQDQLDNALKLHRSETQDDHGGEQSRL